MSIANKKYYNVNPTAARMIDDWHRLAGKKTKPFDVMFGVRAGGLQGVPRSTLIALGEQCVQDYTRIRNRKPGSITVTAKWMVSWGIKHGWITESV